MVETHSRRSGQIQSHPMLKAKLAGSDRWEAFPLRMGHPSQRGQLVKVSFQRVRRPFYKIGRYFITCMIDTSFGCFKTMHAWCLIIIPNTVQNAFTLLTSFDMLIKAFCWAVYLNKWLVNSTGISHLWLTMTPITDKRQLRTHTSYFFFLRRLWGHEGVNMICLLFPCPVIIGSL